jgi:mRNA interferase MazF
VVGVRRGEIWWADLGEPFGSEPGYLRPVVVVQRDDLNASSLRTTIVVQMTTKVHRADAPGNVLCRARDTGLPRDSVVVVASMLTIDRRRFREPVGVLPGPLLRAVDDGLRLALDL